MALLSLPPELLDQITEHVGATHLTTLLVAQRVCVRFRLAVQHYLAKLGRSGGNGGGAGHRRRLHHHHQPPPPPPGTRQRVTTTPDSDTIGQEDAHTEIRGWSPGRDGGGCGTGRLGLGDDSHDDGDGLPHLFRQPPLRRRFSALFSGRRYPEANPEDRDGDELFTRVPWTATRASREPYLRPGASWRGLPVLVPGSGKRVRRVQAVTTLYGREIGSEAWWWEGWDASHGGERKVDGEEREEGEEEERTNGASSGSAEATNTADGRAWLTLGQLWDLPLSDHFEHASGYSWDWCLGRKLRPLPVDADLTDGVDLSGGDLTVDGHTDPEAEHSAILSIDATAYGVIEGFIVDPEDEVIDWWRPEPMEAPLYMGKPHAMSSVRNGY